MPLSSTFFLFFFNAPATTELYTLSLHDALPISCGPAPVSDHQHVHGGVVHVLAEPALVERSEEHTSELQSRFDLVCRLLLEKKKRSPLTSAPTNITSRRAPV